MQKSTQFGLCRMKRYQTGNKNQLILFSQIAGRSPDLRIGGHEEDRTGEEARQKETAGRKAPPSLEPLVV